MHEREIFEDFPTDGIFIDSFKEEARRKGYEPIPYLGLEFAKLGRESIKRKESMFFYDGSQPSEEESEFFTVQTAAEQVTILVGHLIVGMHESVRKGSFDLESLVAKFNEDIRGTMVQKIDLSDDYNKTIDLTYDEYKNVGEIYAQDPTLTHFLKNPKSLPKELYRYLNLERNLFRIPQFYAILDIWQEKSRLLVDNSHNKSTEIPTTQALSGPIFSKAEMEKLEKLKARIDANYK